jgi:hypothetical protein
MIDPHRVKGLYMGEKIGAVRVATDHPGTVALDADDPPVFPVADLVLVGQFQLAQEVRRHGILLGRLLHVLDEAGPFPFFQFIQQGGFRLCHNLTSSLI